MITSATVVGSGISYEIYARQENGVVRGHPDFVMSRGEIVAFAANPEKWLSSQESEDTTATEWGRLVECLEMNPADFGKLFEVHPENYPCESSKRDPRTEKPWTARADYCKEWEEERKAAGITVISPKVKAEADLAVNAAFSYQPRFDLVACSKKQVMVVGEFKDKATGLIIPLRCLIDLVPDENHPEMSKWLADSKTARNGNPEHFVRVVDDEAYDVQAALSIDLFTAATGRDITDWVLPLQENTPPYHIVKPMPALSSEFIEYGRVKYRIALRYYAQCLATNKWPSYPTGDRVVYGPLQFLDPKALFKYREMGGVAPERKQAPPVETFDVPIP